MLLRKHNGKTSKVTQVIISRCNQFINGHFGALLNQWIKDRKKVLRTPRHMPKDSKEKRIKQAIEKVKTAQPHSISRAVNMILGNGLANGNNAAVAEQMRNKHPAADITWEPHTPVGDDSDAIKMIKLPAILDAADLAVGVGPRGVHPHYILCLSRAKNEVTDKTPMEIFESLGSHILANTCTWVSNVLGSVILTPLNKDATTDDARPVSAKDYDVSTWLKEAAKYHAEEIAAAVGPQQLGVGYSSGVQAKIWGLRMMLEQAARDGTPLTLHKEDAKNAHNAFDRKHAIADIRQAAIIDPTLQTFARLADCILSQQTQVYMRTTNNSTGLIELCKIKQGAEQGNAMTGQLFTMAINKVFKSVEHQFPVTCRGIQDDLSTCGAAEVLYAHQGAIKFIIDELQLRGLTTNPAKPRAYGNCPTEREKIPPTGKQPSNITHLWHGNCTGTL